MINELIDQIGRDRLEFLSKAENLPELQKLAQFALAVLNAKPVAFYANGAYYTTERSALKDGAEYVMPLYTTPPAASLQEAIGEVRLGEYRGDGTRHAMVVCLHDQANWENFADGTKLYLRQ